MRRWASDANLVPAGVATDLLRLCLERANTLDELAERLKSA